MIARGHALGNATHSSRKARRDLRTRAMSEGAPKLPVDLSAVLGDKLGRWAATPWDALTFGPRAGAGALVSLPERLQTLQGDMQRLVELVQDPRPVEDKQAVLLEEVESTVLEFLERGAVVEQDVLANLKTMLPAEAANVLSGFIPDPPNRVTQDSYMPDGMAAATDNNVPLVTYGQQDVLAVQIASEITEIRNAVAGLKGTLDSMRSNEDVAAVNMLKLNLREARDQLARRLTEVSPVTAPDPSVAAATREAGILLEEVNSMFFA
ncbi:hypothetical protein V8C86DRAFT_2577607 [Haematococcus lacustris]|nr:hypothetical protein QJQ45_006817 [Haematococcus lacustris]